MDRLIKILRSYCKSGPLIDYLIIEQVVRQENMFVAFFTIAHARDRLNLLFVARIAKAMMQVSLRRLLNLIDF